MGGLGDQNARLYDRVQHSFVKDILIETIPVKNS